MKTNRPVELAQTGFEGFIRKLMAGGLTPKEADQIMARAQSTGRVGPTQREAIRDALLLDGFASEKDREAAIKSGQRGDNFVGQARDALEDFERLQDEVASAEVRPKAKSLLSKGSWDVDPERYRKTVQIACGERATTITDPGGKTRTVRFTDRFAASKKNQLEDVVRWLEGEYARLGLATERQPVKYRGKTYYNLVVTIPGRTKNAILMCDHYDAADAEAVDPKAFEEVKRNQGLSDARIKALLDKVPVGAPAPGADDNASATAALLEAARAFKAEADAGRKFEKTIEIVHLFGEEMPANDAGARAYIRRAQERDRKIDGVVVMDMIGVDRRRTEKMQLSPGRDDRSLHMAAIAMAAAKDLKLAVKPVYRRDGSLRTYLMQTDGVKFSGAHMPVVLLNEFLNNRDGLLRAGYHSGLDVTDLMDFDYATDIVRMAIETGYRLAGPR